MRADLAELLAGSSRRALAQLASSEAALRRTARRYSLCADDAEDAYQRAIEILLTKPPQADRRGLAESRMLTMAGPALDELGATVALEGGLGERASRVTPCAPDTRRAGRCTRVAPLGESLRTRSLHRP